MWSEVVSTSKTCLSMCVERGEYTVKEEDQDLWGERRVIIQKTRDPNHPLSPSGRARSQKDIYQMGRERKEET